MRIKRSDYTNVVRTGSFPCGFCATGSHHVCHNAYRNGDGSIYLCPCDCDQKQTLTCHWCKTQDGEISEAWLCVDVDACEARNKKRLAEHPTLQMIRTHQSAGRQEIQAKTSRPGGGECLCCGEPTKGGRFLPGHDSKWLNKKINEIGGGVVSRADQVKAVAEFSPALAVKLEKRLDGKIG